MRNKHTGGVLFAAGATLVAGLIFVGGSGPTPVAQAQEPECPEDNNARCLLIVKETDPGNDPQEFEFEHEHDGDTTDFELEDGDEAAFIISDEEPHTVTEEAVDGWTLVEIDCDDNEGVDITIDEDEGSVTVTMDVEEEDDFASAVCVFRNERDPTPTPTTTATATPTTTATPVVTVVAPTATPVPGPIVPPSTGSAGLK